MVSRFFPQRISFVLLTQCYFTLCAVAETRAPNIESVERNGDTIVLRASSAGHPLAGAVVQYSASLEPTSWEQWPAEISAQADDQVTASLEADPGLQGYFRLLFQIDGSGTPATTVRINEVMSNNDTSLEDGDGDYPDWIELVNFGESTVDLKDFGLSDNPNRLDKWTFPEGALLEPGAYLIVFASGKEDGEVPAGEWHTGFQIRNGMEPVILTDSEGQVIDQLHPGPLASDHSMGRSRDDENVFYVFNAGQASPGKTNNGFIFGAPPAFIEAPRFSIEGGVYDGPVTVELIAPREGDIVRYTIDGSDPFHSLFTSNSTLYTEPIVIDEPTVIRAKVFRNPNSRTVSASYLVGVEHDLPVLSMATEQENFDFENGFLYGMGPALSGNGNVNGSFPYSSSNAWRREREIEASMEMFEPDGDTGFAMNVGVKIFGGWGSRGYPQKSMAIFARQEYGFGRIRHQLFPDREVDSFESFVLRNSGNDNQSTWLTHPRTEIKAFSQPFSYGSYFVNGNFTLFRDAMVQSLAAETGLDTQGYRPAVLYLNGDYWGIYNIREKLTEHYVASHYDVETDEIDLIEGYGGANSGSASTYNSMRNFVSGRDMNDPDEYQELQERFLDVTNFIDYHLTIIWGQNFDIGNIKCWRPQREEGGQFRWLVYDQDYAFNLWKPDVYIPAMRRDFSDYENMFAFHTNRVGTGTGWPNAGGRTMLLREMLESDAFREAFILRCAELLNHLWSEDRVVERIDTMAGVIRPEIPRHLQRWSWAGIQERGFDHPHKEEDEPLNLEHWERNVEVLRAFARKRPAELRGHLMEHFEMDGGTTRVQISIENPDKGRVVIGGLEVPAASWEGVYFRDLPPTIEAIPNDGASFTGWSGALDGTTLQAELPLTGEVIDLVARFE